MIIVIQLNILPLVQFDDPLRCLAFLKFDVDNILDVNL